MTASRRYLAGLDVGTSTIVAIVAEALDDQQIDVLGMGVSLADGMENGEVVDPGMAGDAVKRAIRHAELSSGVAIPSVYLSVSGTHILGANAFGRTLVEDTDGIIAFADARQAIELASRIAEFRDGECDVLHSIPQEFVVDGLRGIDYPVGLRAASPLEAYVHVVTGDTAQLQRGVACAELAGLTVIARVAAQLAAAAAVLTDEEKELGVALLDIRGVATGFAAFEGGRLRHTAAVAMGGSATVQPEGDLFRLVEEQIRESGYLGTLHAGIVLTGIGALAESVLETAERVLDLPVRRGSPSTVGPWADRVNRPQFATAAGLMIYARDYRSAP